jgi:hypothetical protein
MSAGITRIHGSPVTGTSLDVTGRKSTFFSGYQPLFVKIQTLTSAYDFGTVVAETATADQAGNKFDRFIKACEAYGTVTGYGNPSTTDTTSSSTVIVMFDAGSLNQGDGAGGASGATTGLAALKAAIVGAAATDVDPKTIVAGQIAVTTYTGFTGASWAA